MKGCAAMEINLIIDGELPLTINLPFIPVQGDRIFAFHPGAKAIKCALIIRREIGAKKDGDEIIIALRAIWLEISENERGGLKTMPFPFEL